MNVGLLINSVFTATTTIQNFFVNWEENVL